MQIIRTLLWASVSLIAIFFVFLNWGEGQPVVIWPGDENSSIVFNWPVGFIAFIFFLLGMVPTWLLHRGVKWRLNRRIKTLENAARAAAISPQAVSASEGDTAEPASNPTTDPAPNPAATSDINLDKPTS